MTEKRSGDSSVGEGGTRNLGIKEVRDSITSSRV